MFDSSKASHRPGLLCNEAYDTRFSHGQEFSLGFLDAAVLLEYSVLHLKLAQR